MINERTKRAARRAVERVGQDVDAVQYSRGTEDGYNDAQPTEDSRSTVKARVDWDATPDPIRRADGEDRDVEVEITVKDTVTVDDGAPATRFEVGDEECEVIWADDQDNGTIVAYCEVRR